MLRYAYGCSHVIEKWSYNNHQIRWCMLGHVTVGDEKVDIGNSQTQISSVRENAAFSGHSNLD